MAHFWLFAWLAAGTFLAMGAIVLLFFAGLNAHLRKRQDENW